MLSWLPEELGLAELKCCGSYKCKRFDLVKNKPCGDMPTQADANSRAGSS